MISLSYGSFLSFNSLNILLLLPGQNGRIGTDSIFLKKKIGWYSSDGVKTEIISILKIVFEEFFLTCIDDWIDIIKIECKLTHIIKKGHNFTLITAGSPWKERVWCWTFFYFNFTKLKNTRSVFAL